MTQLKAVISLLVLALLLTSAMYAQDKQVKKEKSNKTALLTSAVKKEKPKSTATAVQSKQCNGQKECSAACTEKHAKGECTGHEPGKCQHDGSSAACIEKHAKGECKGHQAGQTNDKKAGQEKPKK